MDSHHRLVAALVKHCLELVCDRRVVSGTCREIQSAQERNGCHFSLRILCGRSARVHVLPSLWTGN